MTPKESAEYIVDAFYHNNIHYIGSVSKSKESAITCAIISVDSIIRLPMIGEGCMVSLKSKDAGYWIQVKEEINKL